MSVSVHSPVVRFHIFSVPSPAPVTAFTSSNWQQKTTENEKEKLQKVKKTENRNNHETSLKIVTLFFKVKFLITRYNVNTRREGAEQNPLSKFLQVYTPLTSKLYGSVQLWNTKRANLFSLAKLSLFLSKPKLLLLFYHAVAQTQLSKVTLLSKLTLLPLALFNNCSTMWFKKIAFCTKFNLGCICLLYPWH